MSGGDVPYHLRPNKAIERHLFLELLTRFHAYRPLNTYTYVGFGGPFLQDFVAINERFSLARMISIESDAAVFERQRFNVPFTSLERKAQDSAGFIGGFVRDQKNYVIWLDYAEAGARRVQLGEFQSLLAKLDEGDIVKITLNANPASLGKNVGERADAFQAEQRDFLSGRQVVQADVTHANFPAVLLDAALQAARTAISPGLPRFIPLAAYVYADSGHSMLTLTGTISKHGRVIRRLAHLSRWSLSYREGMAPLVIETPVLSSRERSLLDSLLPKYKRTLPARVRFQVSTKKSDSDRLLQSFAVYHRYCPHFARVTY